MMVLHRVCRNASYFKSVFENVHRFYVPDDKVPWCVEYPEYNPLTFNIDGLSTKPWADPEIESPGFSPKWNELDYKVNRKSYGVNYKIYDDCPRNPSGRTGIRGRGRLGRWGPNHAADPIVTRWKRDPDGSAVLDPTSKLPVLQFIAIRRQDCGKWALPGGMIDPGEVVTATLKREFCEEAMNSLSLSPEENVKLDTLVLEFFNHGTIVYQGYVDDPRNTDNAWMETVASNFHDEEGNIVGKFPLEAGDDARQVIWLDINLALELYANHVDFLKEVAHMRNAHC